MTDFRWNSAGLLVSAGAHAVLFAIAALWGDLFSAPDSDPIQIVDMVVVSEEQLEQLINPNPIELLEQPPQETPPEEPVFAEPSFEEPEPTPPEPEAAPEPPEPVVAEAPGPAPYESAPPAPSELTLDPRATQDRSADQEIREALPKVRVQEAPDQIEAARPDAAPSLERAADDPPPEEQVAERANPAVEKAPAQPEVVNKDTPPEPDKPDTPPKAAEKTPEKAQEPEPAPEPEPEPEPQIASVAPQSAPVPRLRPRRAAPKPKEDSFNFDDLDQALKDIPEGVATQQRRTARPATRSRPITPGEIAFFEASFRKHWVRPPDAPDLADLTVVIEVTLSEDGQVLSTKLVEPTTLDNARKKLAVRRAQTAITQGAPYKGPSEKYDSWRYLRVTFDAASNQATIN